LKSIASVAQNFACTISLNHRRFRFSNPTIPYVARDAARNMEYKPSRCAFSGSKAKTSGRYSRCGSKLVCAGFDVAIVSLSRRINPACRCTGVCGVFWSLVLEVERDSQGKKSRPRFSHSIFPGEPGGVVPDRSFHGGNPRFAQSFFVRWPWFVVLGASRSSIE
jgi:hypothetical protein